MQVKQSNKITKELLYVIGHISENKKNMSYMEYGEYVGFFIRENGQLVQNYSCELYKADLDKGYNKYLSEYDIDINKCIKLEQQGIYVIGVGRERYNKIIFLYNKSKELVYKRVLYKNKDFYKIRLANKIICIRRNIIREFSHFKYLP